MENIDLFLLLLEEDKEVGYDYDHCVTWEINSRTKIDTVAAAL